jgi:hypothetical protein
LEPFQLKAGYPLIEDVCRRLTHYLNDHAEKDLDLKEARIFCNYRFAVVIGDKIPKNEIKLLNPS